MKTLVAAGLFLFASICVFAQNPTPAKASPISAPVATIPAAKIDPAKEADIRHLMEVTGASGLATQVMGNMEKNIRPLMTNALPPGDYREQLVELFFPKISPETRPQQSH